MLTVETFYGNTLCGLVIELYITTIILPETFRTKLFTKLILQQKYCVIMFFIRFFPFSMIVVEWHWKYKPQKLTKEIQAVTIIGIPGGIEHCDNGFLINCQTSLTSVSNISAAANVGAFEVCALNFCCCCWCFLYSDAFGAADSGCVCVATVLQLSLLLATLVHFLWYAEPFSHCRCFCAL